MPRSNAMSNGHSPGYGEMGERLRAARQARGLSLRLLAERLGVSASLISQVETGRAKPSVSTLYAIASQLGISLDELLFPDAAAVRGPAVGALDGGAGAAGVGAEEPTGGEETAVALVLPELEPGSADGPPPLQPAATRKAIRLASGVVWERLTTVSMPNVDFLLVTYEVGGASGPEDEFQRHPGQEWGYVLRGTLGITIGFDDYVLKPGDAVSFDSTTPHRLYNLGREPVQAIWFTLGRRAVDLVPAEPKPAGAERA